MMISFTAHCARGHDRVEFTDPLEFERHMTGTHKARRLSYGMPDTPRRGGLPNRYLRPARAPKATRRLSAMLEKAAAEYAQHGGAVGWAPTVADWHTDDPVPLEDVRTGDVFKLGRQTSAEQVVARLDSYSQAEHVDGINQARERAQARRSARRARAEAAAERPRSAS